MRVLGSRQLSVWLKNKIYTFLSNSTPCSGRASLLFDSPPLAPARFLRNRIWRTKFFGTVIVLSTRGKDDAPDCLHHPALTNASGTTALSLSFSLSALSLSQWLVRHQHGLNAVNLRWFKVLWGPRFQPPGRGYAGNGGPNIYSVCC